MRTGMSLPLHKYATSRGDREPSHANEELLLHGTRGFVSGMDLLRRAYIASFVKGSNADVKVP